MSARALKLPVHTTVITGSLNSGKTTFISRLIKIKPQNAVWAVLVNEFGAVGLDRIALESSAASQGLHVKQIAGGCMCCVTGGVLALSIAQLLRSVKPDRLLIEPSGLGHPAGLIDALQGEHLKTALQLNAVLCLVDLNGFQPETLMSEPVFADQVHLSNVLLGSKPDLATKEQQEGFLDFAEQLFPPKQQVLFTTAPDQQLLALLDAPRDVAMPTLFAVRRPRAPPSTSSSRDAADALAALHLEEGSGQPSDSTLQEQLQQTEQDQQQTQHQLAATPHGNATTCGSISVLQQYNQPLPVDGYTACGWLAQEASLFDRAKLQQLVAQVLPLAARFKGVARIGSKQWVTWGTAAGGAECEAAAAPAVPPAAAAAAVGEQKEGVQVSGQQLRAEQHREERKQRERQGWQAAAATMQAHLQLQDIAYRGPSCVQVILPVLTAARTQQQSAGGLSCTHAGEAAPMSPAAEPATTGSQVDMEPQQLGSEAQWSMDTARVAAAVAAGQLGDWGPLEQLLMSCMQL